jgi:hypothetical protein
MGVRRWGWSRHLCSGRLLLLFVDSLCPAVAGDQGERADPICVTYAGLKWFTGAVRTARDEASRSTGPTHPTFLGRVRVCFETPGCDSAAELPIPAPPARHRRWWRLRWVPASHREGLRGKRVALVDDVINAASAVRSAWADLEDAGAQPVALGALMVLGSRRRPFRGRTRGPPAVGWLHCRTRFGSLRGAPSVRRASR